jgi:hypothetical protein
MLAEKVVVALHKEIYLLFVITSMLKYRKLINVCVGDFRLLTYVHVEN